MVLLTMTPALVQALEQLPRPQLPTTSQDHETQTQAAEAAATEPSLSDPSVGKPISHSQVIEISKQLKKLGLFPHHLDTLLRGSKVYTPPPLPEPEPTTEYQGLMARLRLEAEARTYNRMTNPPLSYSASTAPFASTAAYASLSTAEEDDKLTYSDVSRQLTLILNVLISIVSCAAALWWVAKWWSTPARLALSMSGSLVVAVAEVVVYSGYIRRVGEAKQKEGRTREVREVVRTWVVGGRDDDDGGVDVVSKEKGVDEGVVVESKEQQQGLRERKRRKGDR